MVDKTVLKKRLIRALMSLAISLLPISQVNGQSRDRSAGSWVRQHLSADLQGAFLLFVYDGLVSTVHIHTALGYRWHDTWRAGPCASTWGYWGPWSERQLFGYGAHLTYAGNRFFGKCELGHLNMFHESGENDSYANFRDRLNPYLRLHAGYRVAKRFVLGLTLSYVPPTPGSGIRYLPDRLTWEVVPLRRQLFTPQLLFGLALPGEDIRARRTTLRQGNPD